MNFMTLLKTNKQIKKECKTILVNVMERSGDVLVTDQQLTGAKTEQSLGKNYRIQQTRQKPLT